jgi:hypothetical protein
MNILLDASKYYSIECPLFSEEDTLALNLIINKHTTGIGTTVSIPIWKLSQIKLSPQGVVQIAQLAYEEGKQKRSL